MGVSSKSDTFRREGHRSGLGEELGVTDLLAGDERKEREMTTTNVVSVLRRYTETKTLFFSDTRRTSVG